MTSLANSRTLIVGCGFVGTSLAAELTRHGALVWGLSRTPRDLPPGVTAVAADITQPQTLAQRLPEGITHLIFAASAGASSDERYQAVYVRGSRNILDALESGNLQRILFVSSTSVYAQHDGEWVDESSVAAATHFSGQRMLEAERLVSSTAVPATVLRCAGIYGPGRTRLIDMVRRGEATYDQATPRFTNRIHRDDVAGALVHLMQHPTPAALYVGVDEYPAPEREVYDFLARRLNVDGPKAEPRRPSSRSNNKRCSSKLLQSHGYRFRYPTFREGYAAMLGA